jgi:hypothetical protein
MGSVAEFCFERSTLRSRLKKPLITFILKEMEGLNQAEFLLPSGVYQGCTGPVRRRMPARRLGIGRKHPPFREIQQKTERTSKVLEMRSFDRLRVTFVFAKNRGF